MISTYIVVELVNPDESTMLDEKDLNRLHVLIIEGWRINKIENWKNKIGDLIRKGYGFHLERGFEP